MTKLQVLKSSKTSPLYDGERRFDIINSTSSHKAMGADKISARMLKIPAPVTAPSVTKLINHSINNAEDTNMEDS